MAYTKSGMRAVTKYVRLHYDRLEVKVPKGRKADIVSYAQSQDLSFNQYVCDLIRSDMGLTDEEWKRPADGDDDIGGA